MKSSKLDHDQEQEAPPPYKEVKESTSAAQTTARKHLPDLKRSNFVQLSRFNEWLRGSWVIDPAMLIPSRFLPPLSPEETEESRSNISLDVTQFGSIHADIYILTTSPNESISSKAVYRKRTHIRGSTSIGDITMKIHDIPSDTVGERRWPMQITCLSAHGGISLSIPRSFHGPLSLKVSHGSVLYSKAVSPEVTLFSDNDGVQRSFLGYFDATSVHSAGDWAGDSLLAEAGNGSIKILFEDEEISTRSSGAKSEPAKGFIKRWF